MSCLDLRCQNRPVNRSVNRDTGLEMPCCLVTDLLWATLKVILMDSNFGGHPVLNPLVSTCNSHSGAKKAHDWAVDQIADLFRTTTKVTTQQFTRNRGQHCGDVELAGYLANQAGPVPLVLDLRITHE